MDGSYLVFPYPPYVAVMLAPFASLEPLSAKAVFCSVMLLCLIWSGVQLSKKPLRVDLPLVFVIALLFTFGPLTIGVLAGQNSAVSLALYLAIITYLMKSVEGGSMECSKLGALIGLWMFKPHYALLALFFSMLLLRKAKSIASLVLGFGFVAISYYLLASFWLGYDWPESWVRFALIFNQGDHEFDLHQIVSVWGVVEAVKVADLFCVFND